MKTAEEWAHYWNSLCKGAIIRTGSSLLLTEGRLNFIEDIQRDVQSELQKTVDELNRKARSYTEESERQRKTILAQSLVIRQMREALKLPCQNAHDATQWHFLNLAEVRQFQEALSLTNPDESFQKWVEFAKNIVNRPQYYPCDLVEEAASLLKSIGETTH